MEKDKTYIKLEAGSRELVEKLVEDHQGWCVAIAKSVARAWNLDWQLDGLDGSAYEALLGCAKRFDPKLGVPFKAYARKRIHEACTEEARNSKSWQLGTSGASPTEQDSREVSYRMFQVFPELREGLLPLAFENTEDSLRSSIKHLLASASILSVFQEQNISNPETSIEYKRMLEILADLDAVHQNLVWEIYWQGQSMRTVATEWGLNELVVIREHQTILNYVSERMSNPKNKFITKLKIRPKLRFLAQKLEETRNCLPFVKFKNNVASIIVILMIFENSCLQNIC